MNDIETSWRRQGKEADEPFAGIRGRKRLMADELYRRQKGLSPVTRRPLVGRLERHHIKELCEGGDNSLGNQQQVPISEHLAVHYQRSQDPNRTEEDRSRELNTVLGRLGELTTDERTDMENVIEQLTGRRVQVYSYRRRWGKVRWTIE